MNKLTERARLSDSFQPVQIFQIFAHVPANMHALSTLNNRNKGTSFFHTLNVFKKGEDHLNEKTGEKYSTIYSA